MNKNKLIGKKQKKLNKYQSLEGHTCDCLKAVKFEIDQKMSFLKSFCNNWELNLNKLLINIFYSVVLHDIGKGTYKFQKRIKEGKSSSSYPHPYYSLPIVDQYCFSDKKIIPKLFANDNFRVISLVAPVIIGHHTELYNGLYSSTEARTQLDLERVNNFLSEVSQYAKDTDFEKITEHDYNKNIQITNTKIQSDQIIDFIRGSLLEIKESVGVYKLKSVYSLIFSMLKKADIVASRFYDGYQTKKQMTGSILTENKLKNAPEYRCVDMDANLIYNKFNPYEYQQECLDTDNSFVMVDAPCGRGKTEASLGWALNKINKSDRNKLIFALPTQVTCNAMYERLKNKFGENKVGLYHGMSATYFKKEEAKEVEKEEISDLIRDKRYAGENFVLPITVTTVDHLLYAMVHGYSHADFSLGNILDSIVIFDEVHYYEKQLISHLKRLYKTLRQLNIPHFLMSGTLPDFLQQELKEDVAEEDNQYTKIEDAEGKTYTPFVIKKENKSLVIQNEDGYNVNDNVLDKIITHHKKGLRQAVIFNTVNRAQKFYQKIKSKDLDNIELLHSRYLYADRRKKERNILENRNQNPYLLIATQVIEISLDISFDIMHSEKAPIDALAQRAGRLNRGGKEYRFSDKTHEFIIYKTSNDLPYSNSFSSPSKLVEDTVNVISDKPYSYNDITKALNKVYTTDKYDFFKRSNLYELLYECTLFGPKPSEIRFSEEAGKRFQPREQKYQTVNVIPIHIFKEHGKESRKPEYQLQIPLSWIYIDDYKENFVPQDIEDETYIITDLDYTKEMGLLNPKLSIEVDKHEQRENKPNIL